MDDDITRDLLIAVTDELDRLLGKPFEIEYARTHLIVKLRFQNTEVWAYRRLGIMRFVDQDLRFFFDSISGEGLIEKSWNIANPAFSLEVVAEYLKSGVK